MFSERLAPSLFPMLGCEASPGTRIATKKCFGPVFCRRGNIVTRCMSPACKVLDIGVAPFSGSERDVLNRFREGDSEAFSALNRDQSPAVYRFALHTTGDNLKAAEITQDVSVWLIRHPEKFDSERGNLASFLTGVARHCIRRQQRIELRWLPFQQGCRRRRSFVSVSNRSIIC